MADSNGDGTTATNSIADQLGLSLDDFESGLSFDYSEDGEQYDQWTDFDRTPLFDIVWSVVDEYPPAVDDDVIQAVVDDTDHTYRIDFDGQDGVRETGVGVLALFAWDDPDASVEVDDS